MRRALGIAVILVGNLLLGWGTYHLLEVANCGGRFAPCPASAFPYFAAEGAGVLLSIAGVFLGGTIGIFTLGATIGIASIWRGFDGGAGIEHGTAYAFVFGGMFLLSSLAGLFVVLFVNGAEGRRRRMRARGRRGIGTVLAAEGTRVSIGGNPRMRLKLSIRPDNGEPAFESERTVVVPRLDLPRPGDRYPVWYSPWNRWRFALGDKIREPGFSRAEDPLLAGSPPAPAA